MENIGDLAKEASELTKKQSQVKKDFDEEVTEDDPDIIAGGELPDDEQEYLDGQQRELREIGL